MTFEMNDCSLLVSKGKPKMPQFVSVLDVVSFRVREGITLNLAKRFRLTALRGNKQFKIVFNQAWTITASGRSAAAPQGRSGRSQI